MVGNRKGRWILDEDRLLVRLVSEYSVDGEDIDWSVLEQHFKGTRDSKQIRERWVNHLNPRIKKRKFSDEEIKIIEDECSKHKFKWARIAKKIPNATPLMIKNFYNNRLKKKNPANRRLSTSANITPFTINNFNHNPITSTTNTTIANNTTNTINTFNTINTTTNINHNHNSNYNYYSNEYNEYHNNEYHSNEYHNHSNDYHQEQDFSYYSEPNLKRSDSGRTVVGDESNCPIKAMESDYSTTNLSRNSSIRTNCSAKTMVEYNEHEYEYKCKSEFFNTQMSSSQLPSPPPSADGLKFLATVANIVGQSESSPTTPSPPKKPGKMSITNLIS